MHIYGGLVVYVVRVTLTIAISFHHPASGFIPFSIDSRSELSRCSMLFQTHDISLILLGFSSLISGVLGSYLAGPGTFSLCYGPDRPLPADCAGDINAGLVFNNCVCFVCRTICTPTYIMESQFDASCRQTVPKTITARTHAIMYVCYCLKISSSYESGMIVADCWKNYNAPYGYCTPGG